MLSPDLAVASAPTGAGALVCPAERGFFGLRKVEARLRRITLRVQRDGRQVTVTVTADGDDQTVNHAGAALLAETADRLGLTRALSAELAGLRQRRAGTIRAA